MEKRQEKKLVVQSKQLIEGRYNFTLWELRLYLAMVEMIKKDDTDFRDYRIYFKDLIKEYGSKSKDEYKLIRISAQRLLKKLVKLNYIDENGFNRCVETHLLAAVDYPKNWRDKDENSYLELSFSPHLKPYLLDLKGNFLLYDRRNILMLKSKFSVRIYQILKGHERKTSDSMVIEYQVQELRGMLLVDDNGNPTKQYSDYNTFKKRVILQAQKELQKYTDIAFSFDEIKKGKRIDRIRFYLRKNRKKKPTDSREEKPANSENASEVPVKQSEALRALTRVGIEIDKALSLIKTLGEKVALDEFKHARKALKEAYNVKSETGFIIRMMEKQSYTKSQAIKKAEQEEKKKKAAEHKAQIELQKKRITELRLEYTRERNKAVNLLFKDLDKGQIAELVEEYAMEKPYIAKAIKKAEEKGNTDEANDFKYGLFVRDLKDESLHTFEQYIKRAHQLQLIDTGKDKFLINVL